MGLNTDRIPPDKQGCSGGEVDRHRRQVISIAGSVGWNNLRGASACGLHKALNG
ncbi:MAG: hypothetical protein OXI38_08450 [Bacteroidota bacterium]|nr:hypothetical protein [Bacteroidota bacterium]